MKKRDLLWLLAFPFYLVIGTIRHEGGHALMAIAQGAVIEEFVFIPSFWREQFYFGYVVWSGGNTDWLTVAAPYFLDLLTFIIFFVLCYFVPFKRHWLWLNLVILGVFSPLVNSSYQYFKVGMMLHGDIGELLRELNPLWVHGYMLLMILLYLTGCVMLITYSIHIRSQQVEALPANQLRKEITDV